ncbi:helix-turn-helix domain-containing protein [Marinobacter sp.]
MREKRISIPAASAAAGSSQISYRELGESVLKARAIQLLRYTNRSVSEIACELGYADLCSFSRAFRKWTGKSASEFREGGADPAPELGP